jgi:hypothetical protein
MIPLTVYVLIMFHDSRGAAEPFTRVYASVESAVKAGKELPITQQWYVKAHEVQE